MAHRPHRRFRAPSDKDAPIWRYVSFDKFLSLFSGSNMYFRSAVLFQDSFEGSFPYAFGPKRPINECNPSAAYESIEEFEEDLAAIGAEMERFTYHANVRPITYVNCWTMRRSECVAMWSIYLEGAPGVAIRSSYNRLCAAFAPAIDDVYIGKVRYLDHLSREPAKGLIRINPAMLKFEP